MVVLLRMNNDTARCGNTSCPMRYGCQRFTQHLKDVEERKGLKINVSMFKPVSKDECLFKIDEKL